LIIYHFTHNFCFNSLISRQEPTPSLPILLAKFEANTSTSPFIPLRHKHSFIHSFIHSPTLLHFFFVCLYGAVNFIVRQLLDSALMSSRANHNTMHHPTRRRGPRSHNHSIKPDPDSSTNISYSESTTFNFDVPPAPSVASSYGGSTNHIPPDQAFYRHGRSDAREYLISAHKRYMLIVHPKPLQVNALLSLSLY
jgi:hypothetical protein